MQGLNAKAPTADEVRDLLADAESYKRQLVQAGKSVHSAGH